MSLMYDIAIIGSGPAGLSAALNAKIRRKSFVLFGNKDLSSKIQKAKRVNNYLGFPYIEGKELAKAFANHIKQQGIEITEEKVNNVYPMGKYFIVMADNKVYESKTVIIAVGMESSRELKGEKEFLGRGVSYCTTCDAALYKDKNVVVVSSSSRGEKEADFLSETSSKVYYIPLYKSVGKLNNHIELIHDKPIRIYGNDKVQEVLLKNGKIETEGVFILRESILLSQLIPGLKIKDGHIHCDRLMKTNIPGCFAAGDCTGGPYQYIKAAGEGNVASISAIKYLDLTYN